jgi:hypothetical protein
VIVDEIVAAGGQPISAAADAQQEAGMVDILDRLEGIDPVEVGVYDAGNTIWGLPLETKLADFEAMWRVGCLGGFIFGREVARRMLRRGYGTIITPGPQQLFAEEQHLLHSPLLKLASGWSVNLSHANSDHAVFTSLTSSSTVPSRAIKSLARFLISDGRRGQTACCTQM